MSQTITSAVENYLREVFTSSEFPVIDYDREGAREFPQPVKARTCEVGEEECNFDIDKRVGIRVAVRPLSWTVKALVTFPRKVDLRQASMTIFGNQILVPAADGHPIFRVTLRSYRAEHPVRMEPGHGTKASFIFQIDTTRGI